MSYIKLYIDQCEERGLDPFSDEYHKEIVEEIQAQREHAEMKEFLQDFIETEDPKQYEQQEREGKEL